MSLFEWFGESYNPGPVGSVDARGRSRGRRPRVGVIVYFGLAVFLLGLWAYLVLGVWEVRDAAGLAGVALGTGLYLLLGYTLHPKPDMTNVGWAGGLFDHPFRYSDDINRSLIFLTVFLWPGRFVSESLVDMVGLVAHASRTGPKRTRADNSRTEV
jgi:hypothetical protein